MLKLLNPWILVAAVLVLIAVFAGGVKTGSSYTKGKQAQTELLIAAVSDKAQEGAAKAIAANRPINQFNKQVVEHEIRTVVDYAQCHHSVDGLRGLNAALQNVKAETVDHSGLPDANPLN